MGEHKDTESGPKSSPEGSRTVRMSSLLKIQRLYIGDRCKISLSGELRHGNAEHLLANVQDAFESGSREVLLDFSRVEYCDTAGLQSLVQIFKYVQSNQGWKFWIYAPEGMVMETLQTCRFDKFLDITQNPADLEGDWRAH